MKKSLAEDIIVFSMLAGTLGTLGKTVTSGVPYFLGISKSAGFIEAGEIIFHTKNLPIDIGHVLIGELTHIGIGALIAIGLTYFLYIAGVRFYLLKSIFYSFLVWILLRNMLITLAVPGVRGSIDLVTNIISLSGHLIYGIISGYVIVRYNKFTPEFK